MILNKKVLAIIPARGGSKGVPRKNIKSLAGKPLIAWSIEEATKSKYIDSLILSSEDNEIINVAKSYGCEAPFIRPKELAQDETPGIDPILHAIEQLPKYDYVVILQPTSPLRNVSDIDLAIEKSAQNNGVGVVSVTESDSSPHWMYNIDKRGRMTSLLDIEEIPVRRQEVPTTYVLNGAVYVSTTKNLLKEKSLIQTETIAHVMPRERSIDIDSEIDFRLCELILNDNN